jgi:hypothetical protein
LVQTCLESHQVRLLADKLKPNAAKGSCCVSLRKLP